MGTAGTASIRQILPTDPKIQLIQGNSTEVTSIKRTKLEDSHRMLGVLMNPLGDFGDHVKFLKQKAEELVLSSVANLVHLCGEDVGSNPAWTISCR